MQNIIIIIYSLQNIKNKAIEKQKTRLILYFWYLINESTWEPISHLKYILDQVKEFEEKYEKKNKAKTDNKDSSTEDVKEEKEPENLSGKKRKREEEIEEDYCNRYREERILIDKSLKKILSVKKEKNGIVAVVEKEDKNKKITKEIISTNDLKKTNPWMLIDYYESKIKFL